VTGSEASITDWNFADVWETVAGVRSGAPVLVQGQRRVTWEEFDARAGGVAAALVGAGLGHQAKVAQYLYNCPEYMESVFAALKAGLVAVNTNYRYTPDELCYLWDNADVEAVVFGGSFVAQAGAARRRLPAVRSWWWVDDGGGEKPSWAVPYEEAARAADGGFRAPWRRSGDDLLMIYTGGTTGLPKGVMWRQDDLFAILNRSADVRYDEGGGAASVASTLEGPLRYPPPRLVPCAPLMHGTGLFTAMSALSSGGSLVLLQGRHFSPVELLDTIERERVTELSLVGDAFARPLLAELDAHPGRWDISTLWLIISSGVMWSAEVKQGLLRHQPRLKMVDNLGSSEAIGLARSQTSHLAKASTGGFQLGPDTMVITEDGRPVTPGSGERGLVALRGRMPVGYYKDPAKTAATFRVIGGQRWSVPGDWATVDADGTVRLLGRGSVVINTGGEKVFPEEVEEVLKQHPAVSDAVVVGVAHPRFGEEVVSVVEPAGGASLDECELIEWVKGRLAGYKAPRRVITVVSVGRADNGKVDYRRIKQQVTAVRG
jgi:acyl-CoA synthetase (AMP-forming)/AMP-acid ligase II